MNKLGMRHRKFDKYVPLGVAAFIAAMSTSTLQAGITYTYDEAGRLRQVASDDCISTDYVLDAAGNRVSKRMNSGTVSLVKFVSAEYIVNEGQSLQIPVNRCGTGSAASVSYAISGTATNGADYTISGALQWGANDFTTRYVAISVAGNDGQEGSEYIVLTLQSPSGFSLGSRAKTTVRIDGQSTTQPPNCQTNPSLCQ